MSNPEIKCDYKDKNTLKINFNFPAGIGSFSRDEEEIIKDFPELVKICDKINLDIYEAIQLTENIENTIYDALGDSVNIDWRDDKVVEIHNINDLESLFSDLNVVVNQVRSISNERSLKGD